MKTKAVLSVLVGLALMLSLDIAVKDAKADVIMFPWVTKSATVSTIISVVNTAQGDPDFDELLHFQYWYKIPYPHTDKVNDQENWCEEYDFKATTSKDDLVSFDASGTINSGLPLWNDNDPNHPNTPLFADSYALNVDGARRSFLLVDNNTPNISQIATNNADGTLYGEAMVVELTTGAAWGYVAFNALGSGEEVALGPYATQDDAVFFFDLTDAHGEVIGDFESTQTVILNPNSVKTRFFVTPVTINYDPAQNIRMQRSPNINARVQLCRVPTYPTSYPPIGAGDCASPGIFDNIEGSISFTKLKEIVCTSADDIEEFMGTSTYNAFKNSGRSGWGYIVTHLGTLDVNPFDLLPDNPTGDVIIGKLEFTETALNIDGMTIPTKEGVAGGINNFLWLMDNESLDAFWGINIIHNEPYSRVPIP